MPNGGVTPDCIHCKRFTGKPITTHEPYCEYHKINLPTPIRAFCKNYVDHDPLDGIDWLDSKLDRKTLDDKLMYVWLGGYDIKFFHVELTTIVEYSQWDSDTFFEHIQILDDKYLG